MRLFSNLRFGARLALVMFLTTACTVAILIVTYLTQEQRIRAYVSGATSNLVAISQLTNAQLPTGSDQTQILEAYKEELVKAGFKQVDVTSPSGEIKDSTDPQRVKKKIHLRRGARLKVKKNGPFQISASLPDTDVSPEANQTTYPVQFPVVQKDKVVGYVAVHGVSDEAATLLRQTALERSVWILLTLLVGLSAVVYLAFVFTRPIDTLATGAKQVAQGNLYVRLPETGGGEISRLAQTFNQMVERLRENRELQARLNEAEKTSLLGRFAATVAHEVRNSLNFMNLSIDQMRAKRAAACDQDVERNLANVKDEINRMNRLVSEFLAAGRQAPPELAPCDVRATIEEAVALVDRQAQAQDIAITSELPADLPRLEADAGQLKTCFLNILTNAVQAMPEGGQVHITASRKPSRGAEGGLELRFSDTGPGVRPEDRERIFAPYFSTKATGFGLGLAITKKIVEDHGGRIYVTDGETHGTVIVVELPITHPAPAAVTTAA